VAAPALERLAAGEEITTPSGVKGTPPVFRRSNHLYNRREPAPFCSSSTTGFMANWIRIATLDECPPGSCLERIAEDRVVALFNVEGTLHALDGVCPHQGGPLGKGSLTGAIVTCPWHGWQFDVGTGQHQLSRTIIQPRFDVRLDGNDVFVNLGPSHS
jgi:nitrite reductase (NADH) small subunit